MILRFLRASRASVAAALFAGVLSASAQTWNFSSDAQGWVIRDLAGVGDYVTNFGTYTLDWNATGGNPGGYVSRVDPTSNTFFFEAPSASLGNYSAYVGGQLTFSLRSTLNSWTLDNVVVLRGGAGNTTIVAAITPLPIPDWSTYAIGLTADQFRYNNLSGGVVSSGDFASILGNLQVFRISAEYGAVVEEVSGLDSVAFTAVPEPSTTAALLGAAGLGVAFFARRRQQS